ncbi:MAG TPA: condensation domain-containing protein, partial [Bacteroidia bacterium]|nr:condensation domain-containing protein [Bacteroidia bacterium]
MNIPDLLQQLKASNVVLKLHGDQLKLVGDTTRLDKEFIEGIKERKAELISFLKERASYSHFDAIVPIAKQEYYPVSGAQKRIWIISQFDGGSSAYNIVTSFYLKGKVIGSYLNKAFLDVIGKHESLRTVFNEIGGEVKQKVLDAFHFNLEEAELKNRAEQIEKLEAEISSCHHYKFSLQTGPLLKVKLIKLGNNRYALIVTMHHIICD